MNTKKFKDYFLQWNRCPQIQKTWNNFKMHFTAAQNELKEYGGLSIQDSEFHHANIVNDVIRGIEGLLLEHQEEEAKEQDPPTQQANAAQQQQPPATQDQNLAMLMQQNQYLMQQLMQRPRGGRGGGRGYRGRGHGYGRGRNNFNYRSFQAANNYGYNHVNPMNYLPPQAFPPNQGFNRNALPPQYCWTHGAGHNGFRCQNPADGHRPEATFQNRMGGNNRGCDAYGPPQAPVFMPPPQPGTFMQPPPGFAPPRQA